VKRRSYSADFKAKVAMEAVKGLQTANEIASKFEVHPGQVAQWKRELIDNVGDIFARKNAKKPPDSNETDSKLFEQIGRMKVEIDWLKKKSEQLGIL
jgi:transposase-like protein